GVWNHYVSVFDGTNLTLYVNGAQYSQVAATAPGSTATVPIKMGPHYSNPATYGVVNGMFDDVRVYSRALSSTDIGTLYNYAGSSCTYSISQTSTSFTPRGGTGSVAVTAGSNCPWTATSSAIWLTITAGANGTGNGTVSYSVAPNTNTTALSATLTIAGQTFTITE